MDALSPPIQFGAYRLVARVDRGGMADVFLGLHAQPSKLGTSHPFFAIKKLLTHLNSNKPFVNLLIHEAKIGVLLSHPSITSVYDLGSYKTEFFIAMEYVHGRSLERLLQRVTERASLRDLLSLELTTYIILEVLRALAFAHDLKDSQNRELNIVHRDISPGNVLLSYRGEVKVTDFGIATAEHRLQPGFTQVALGKLKYISPEQAVNDTVSRTSDLYSLAVVYYQMLTGRTPFEAADSQSLLKKVLEGKILAAHEATPKIPKPVSAIISKALSKTSRQRHQSASEFFNELVSHFKQSANLDFTSRTVRAFYQKKLSELLKAGFAAEFANSSSIFEIALKESAESNKETAPQVLTAPRPERNAYYDEAPEHTVVLQDLGGEETRVGGLNLEDRELIFATAKNIRNDDQSEPELLALNEPLVEFSTTTASQKIKNSSLSREQKEMLESKLPKIEITSTQKLSEFEQITFSSFERPLPKMLREKIAGRKSEESDSATRAMSRADIIRDFDQYKREPKKQRPAPEPNHTFLVIKKALRRWKILFGFSLVLLFLAAAYYLSARL